MNTTFTLIETLKTNFIIIILLYQIQRISIIEFAPNRNINNYLKNIRAIKVLIASQIFNT